MHLFVVRVIVENRNIMILLTAIVFCCRVLMGCSKSVARIAEQFCRASSRAAGSKTVIGAYQPWRCSESNGCELRGRVQQFGQGLQGRLADSGANFVAARHVSCAAYHHCPEHDHEEDAYPSLTRLHGSFPRRDLDLSASPSSLGRCGGFRVLQPVPATRGTDGRLCLSGLGFADCSLVSSI